MARRNPLTDDMPVRLCVNYGHGNDVQPAYYQNPLEYDAEEEDFGTHFLNKELDESKSPQSWYPKMYGCSHDGCDATFATIANKKRHEKNHCGDRPYACEHGCGKSFSRKYDMKVHLRVHTKEKPYECTVGGCGKKFSRNSSLREHERSIHHINQSRRRSFSSDESDYSPSPVFTIGGSYSNPSIIKRENSEQLMGERIRRSNSIDVTDPSTKAEIASLVQRYQDAKNRSTSFTLDQLLPAATPRLAEGPSELFPTAARPEYKQEYATEQEREETSCPWVLPLTNQLLL